MPGFAEHYDACRKCITEKTVHGIETYPHTEKVEETTADTEYHVDPENQTAIAHEIIIYDHVTGPPDTIYDERTDGNDIEGISFGPEFIAQPFSFTQDRGDTEMNDEPSESTASNSNIQEEDVSTIVPQHFQAVTPRKAAKFVTPVKKKTVRKRKATPQIWKKNVRKQLRLSGKKYESTTGKTMPEKQMKPPCNNCRFKCTSKISKEERQRLFSSFWTLESYERQKYFVCCNVTERKTRTYIDENESAQPKKRMVVRTYNLESGGQVHNVCKKFFMATLCVGDAYVSHAMKMKLNGRFSGNENHGKHTPYSKTEQIKLLRIHEHIESFPKVASHYIRKTSTRQFLGPELNISRIYDLYQEKCQLEGEEPASNYI